MRAGGEAPAKVESANDFAAVIGAFLDSASRAVPDELPSLVSVAATGFGAASTTLWLADHDYRRLVRVFPFDADEEQAIDGTMAGRAFIGGDIVDASLGPERSTMWVPLVNGIGRIGVLEVEVRVVSDALRTELRHLAAIVTGELIARGQYTDYFTLVRRRRSMSLAGELQWQLLPPTSFETLDVSLAGMLEPAYEIGGDAFDYSRDGDVLHFAIFDAVGHDLDSSIVCSLAVGAYRNRRRAGDGLIDIARFIDRVLAEKYGAARYSTGQLGRLDATTGRVEIVNAGHPLPLIIRDARFVVPLECPPCVPFGVSAIAGFGAETVHRAQLEPGDSLLLYSDGVVEARRTGGADFTVERLADFVQRALSAGLSPAESMRRLSHAVFDYQNGTLQDDATMMMLRWHPRPRMASDP